MLSHQWEQHCGDWIKDLVDIVLPVAAASLLVSHEDRRQAVPRQAQGRAQDLGGWYLKCQVV